MKSNFLAPAVFCTLLSIACMMVILYGLWTILKRTGWAPQKQLQIFLFATIILVAWAGLLSLLSVKGFFADFTKLPPRPLLAILVPLPFVLWFAFSKTGSRLLEEVPAQWLVFMQSFRILVEVMLWLAFIKNLLPVQMTFEGRNFDVFTGILALPAGYLLVKNKSYSLKTTLLFNIAGLILLLNILIIALLSMPTPIRYFMNEPSNTIVAQFPFILLAGVLVPVAYSFHIFSLRKLYLNRANKIKL